MTLNGTAQALSCPATSTFLQQNGFSSKESTNIKQEAKNEQLKRIRVQQHLHVANGKTLLGSINPYAIVHGSRIGQQADRGVSSGQHSDHIQKLNTAAPYSREAVD